MTPDSTILQDTPEKTLGYEKDCIAEAIIRIQGLKEKSSNKNAGEFYQIIEDVLIALSFAATESQTMRRAYDNMASRVKIMETLLEKFVTNNEQKPS